MTRLIDSSQSAFLKGRYILDNVLVAQETIHFSQTQNQEGAVIKVDFEKAYDKISWQYLLEVLKLKDLVDPLGSAVVIQFTVMY